MFSRAMPNRLAREVSPYLQQHAYNPVDWYPWGTEALERAVREDKPILLSIGYSACHWCHVMERESFDDAAIAAKMNELFVCIKVDREERPDLDHVYQMVVQLMGRSGGWPLTVFLTPSRKPFYAGTYFPPRDRYGMPGFPKILDAVAEAYRERREEVAAQADELSAAIQSVMDQEGKKGGPAEIPADALVRAATALGKRFDDVHGGFGGRPKFPSTMSLDVLLRRGVLDADASALARVCLALDGMRAGGIWDHLGGGFHRYSTDERWLVPHFEKMLYDNALLLRLYADGFRATGEARYRDTARAIVAYVMREMTHPEGGFYSSQDADSEGEEGKFFVWTPGQIREVLGADEAAARAAIETFGVTEEGNFEETGATVLHRAKEPSDPAALERARAALFAAREERPKPFRDEKILASWNGLMMGALAEAGAALDEPTWIEAARRAFAFLEQKLLVTDGAGLRVLRHFKDGAVKGPGFLDDHAYVADAAIDLYEATGEPAYIARARALVDTILARFADRDGGGFFFVPDDGESLIVRAKDPFDHAIPSGTAVAIRALQRLGTLADATYAETAQRELSRMARAAVENPFGFGQTVCNLDREIRGSVDVVLVGARGDARTHALARTAFASYMPNRTLAWLDPHDDASRTACAALAEGKPAKDTPVAYVCRGRTCSLPVSSPDALEKLLQPR
jgi:hypothetical protein